MPSITISFEGEYDEDFINKGMFILGELVINEIKNQIRNMKLISEVGGGQYLQGWFSNWDGNTLTIDNRMPYAPYLEYGTYEFGGMYNEENFPPRMLPKKKDLPKQLRDAFPRGMQPFAPSRKVLYNPLTMRKLVQAAFGNL